MVSTYSSTRHAVSPWPGRWYFTEGITGMLPLPGRVRRPARPAPGSPSNDCHQPRPCQVMVQPSAAVAGLMIGSATIRDSLIAQARHRLPARGVLGDHRLEDDEPQAVVRGLLELGEVQRELARGLAPGVAQGDSGVGGRHVQVVGVAEVVIEIAGQALRANRSWSAPTWLYQSPAVTSGDSGQKMRPDWRS